MFVTILMYVSWLINRSAQVLLVALCWASSEVVDMRV